ncbi:MAG: hypothetical protein ACYSWX_04315, partial [Planctomycetota bacterium]
MIKPLLLLCALSPATAPTWANQAIHASGASTHAQDRKAEFDERYEAAKDDLDALWELHRWTEIYELDREGRKVLRRIVKLDEDDRKARELLGHVEVDGRWFESEKKAEKYRQKKAEEEAEAKGWVEYEGRWVDPAHIPFIEQGLVLSDDGEWVDPVVLERIEQGWVRQDLTWIAPDEQDNLDKGLWKVGDAWVSLEEANAMHRELYAWWQIPGNRFTIWSTSDREHANRVLREIDSTYTDLVRIFGREPAQRPHVIVLDDLDQYSTFAGGKENLAPADSLGHSALHDAFFADTLYTPEGFFGTGASYWDGSSEQGDAFGRHFARHAAGLAFVEAIDPSREFVAKVARSPRTLERGLDKFYDEKRIAPFLRYGAASYVERFFFDRSIAREGDPEWASKWAWENIQGKGGLDGMEQMLECRLDAGDEFGVARSRNLLAQLGLVM